MNDDKKLPPDTDENEPSYEVGYGKPPTHSQFKKGNKQGKGRPRGSRNMKTYVRDALEERVTASIGGKTRKLPKIAVGMHQLANRASKGDLKAIAQAVPLYERYCTPPDADPIPEDEHAYNLETMRHYFKMRDFDDE